MASSTETRFGTGARDLGWTLSVFVLAFAIFAAILSRFSALYDADSYYHLAVARLYWRSGVVGLRGGLAWARLSALSQGFGDKEILFHLLLAPFAGLGGATGGRVALAFLDALLMAVLAHVSMRAVGRWGVLVPLWLVVGSADFTSRILRLRPELLSLVLFLAATWLAAAGRHRALGLVAALLVLSHTGFHALVLLAAGWLLYEGLALRRWDWDLLAYPLLGMAVGLLIHPQFPANVRVWILQNIERYREVLPDAGAEFQSITIRDAIELNAGWLLGLLVLWRAGRSVPGAEGRASSGLAGYLGVAVLFFGALFALMSRFALYLVPFGAWALLSSMRDRGLRPSAWTRLPWRGRVPTAVGMAVVLLLGARTVLVTHWNLRASGVFLAGLEADGARFGADLPRGARVAATWADAEFYSFWAPQATYLNVLDPIFLAAWNPAAYKATVAVFSGREPDVPLSVATILESDYLALSRGSGIQLQARLDRDPRLHLLYRGYNTLYALASANGAFVLDWRVVPEGVALPPGPPSEHDDWPRYPRASTPRARSVEGFVDARRVSSGERCVALTRSWRVQGTGRERYELSPYGATRVWLDQEPIVATRASLRAVLGRGLLLDLRLGAGSHSLTVLTCPAEGRTGFYLRSLPPEAPVVGSLPGELLQ
jgi:hypothetical protein